MTYHGVDLGIAEDGPSQLGALGRLHALGDGQDDVVGLAEGAEEVLGGLGRAGPVGDAGVRLRPEALLGGAEGDLAEDVGDDGLVGIELELEELEAAGLGIHEEEDDLEGRARSRRLGRGSLGRGRSGGGGRGRSGEGLAVLVEDDAVHGLLLGAGTGGGAGGLGRDLGRRLLEGQVGNGCLLLLADEASHEGLGLLGHGPEGRARPAAAGGGARLLFSSASGHSFLLLYLRSNGRLAMIVVAPTSKKTSVRVRVFVRCVRGCACDHDGRQARRFLARISSTNKNRNGQKTAIDSSIRQNSRFFGRWSRIRSIGPEVYDNE